MNPNDIVLNDKVRIRCNDTDGVVESICHSLNTPGPRFEVKYVDKNNLVVTRWFRSDELILLRAEPAGT